MSKSLQIDFNEHDLGQLLDGLRSRAEAWTKTADYLEYCIRANATFLREECSDSAESRHIAQHYGKMISENERQIEQQGGWQ